MNFPEAVRLGSGGRLRPNGLLGGANFTELVLRSLCRKPKTGEIAGCRER
ncbi:hypothetical protein [Geobacter sp.]|nr:hypothetical protein [Geobacter sp.]